MEYGELISKMTLEEKASLMSGKDFWQTMDLPAHGIPSIFLADGPHGIRKQAAAADHLGLNASIPATCFPTAATMANSWNDELGEEMGKRLGEEAVAQKVNVLLGPGTNMKRNPLCGRNFEYFSEDPFLAGKMAAAYIRGIQSNGISACVKHFACNNQEERRLVIDSVLDERTLREIYLPAFEMAVKEGKVETLMSAYNLVNGDFANENMHLMMEILRKEWGFEGVVVTDWGGDNDRVKGLIAGNELEMPTTCGETNLEIVNAVKNGELDEKILDERVNNLLKLIFKTEEAFKGEKKTFDVEEHHQIAEKAAEEAIVLLKNENSVLPLAEGTRVAIIGDFAQKARFQGAGSSVVNPTKLDDTLDVFNGSGLNLVGFEKGFDRYGKKKKGLIKKAVKLAKNADVILIYVGLDEVTEAEGLDRSNMVLPQNQKDLVDALTKLGKKTVAVLSCGSAIETDWTDNLDGFIHGYLNGQAGAKAVLNVMTGKTNPSGKLAETYPIKYADCSSASHFPGHEMTVEYREGLFIGYRYYDTAGVPVKFPFGFGLSYTKFDYTDIAVSEDGVTFTITNSGERDGAEAAQLYVGMKDSKIFRAKKELKGFKKVFLKAGESKSVTIPFNDMTFRYFDVSTNQWEVESGVYQIMIAASSTDVRLEKDFAVKGTTTISPYDKEKLPSYYSGNVANVSAEEFETLLGRPIPDSKFKFYKKKRLVVEYNTTVAQLRYARGWSGRFFAWGIRFGYKLLRGFGNRTLANTLIMGVYHQPMRAMSRMTGGAISWGQLGGMMTMFNGHFFKGLGIFLKEGKKKKRAAKAAKKQAELESKA